MSLAKLRKDAAPAAPKAAAETVVRVSNFMHKGKVWEIGPTDQLFANPRTTELAQFIASVL